MHSHGLLCSAAVVATGLLFAQGSATPLGMFTGHSDIGTVFHPGSAEFDPASQTYTLTGSGDDIWSVKDSFQYVWRKMSDDNVTLTADISILGAGGDNHRKGVLMVRQSLDDDSPYADVARHGDGLTSLQFRDEKGGVTHEIESSVSAPTQLRIEKRSDRFYMWIGNGVGYELKFAGGSVRVPLKAPFYVGFGVCAHNKDAVQKVAFLNVGLTTTQTRPDAPHSLYSTLETINVASTDARVSYVSQDHLENASWTDDGSSLLFHGPGATQRVPLAGGNPQSSAARPDKNQKIADDPSDPHARVSPDGKQVAFLAPSDVKGEVLLSVLSLADRTSRTIAKLPGGPGSLGPHPWSPDGKRLAFISYQDIQ